MSDKNIIPVQRLLVATKSHRHKFSLGSVWSFCFRVTRLLSDMGEFARRVLGYPVINGTVNMFGGALKWLLGADRYNSWFNFGQQAATLVKDSTVSVAGNATVDRLDTIACRQILDRLESLVPQVHQSPEEAFAPLVERAISLAECFLTYFVDSSELTTCAAGPPPSHADRLARLHSTVMNMQAVRSAMSTSSSVYRKMQEYLTTLLNLAHRSPVEGESDPTITSGAVSSESATDVLSHLLSQYQSAAVVAFPKFHNFIDGSVSQAQQLITEIRQTGPTEFVVEQLGSLTRGLHNTLICLNTSRTAWIQSLLSQSSEEAEQGSPAELPSAPTQADDESLQAHHKAATAEISDSISTSSGPQSDINSPIMLEAQSASAIPATTDDDGEETQPATHDTLSDVIEQEQSSEKFGSRKKLKPVATASHEVPDQDTLHDDTSKAIEDHGDGPVYTDAKSNNDGAAETEDRKLDLKAQSKSHKHRPLTPTGAASCKESSITGAEAQPKCEPQTVPFEAVGDGGVDGCQSLVHSNTDQEHTPATAGGQHMNEGGLQTGALSESVEVDSGEIDDGEGESSQPVTETHTKSPLMPEGASAAKDRVCDAETPCDKPVIVSESAAHCPESKTFECSRVEKSEAESRQKHVKNDGLEDANMGQNGDHTKQSKGKQHRGTNSGSRTKVAPRTANLSEPIADAPPASEHETFSEEPTTMTDTVSAAFPSGIPKPRQETENARRPEEPDESHLTPP
ncbi:hypothetical protein SprV_0100187000 [Sparganum proliferum]